MRAAPVGPGMHSTVPTFGARGRDALVALAVGAGHATWLFAAGGAAVSFPAPVLVWAIGGLALLAAVPAFLLLRRLLVVPAALVVWTSVTVGLAGASAGPQGPFGLYAVAWIVPLVVALALGAIEYGLRRWSGLARPMPLAEL